VLGCDEPHIIRLDISNDGDSEKSRMYATLLAAFTANKPIYVLVSSCLSLGDGPSRPDLQGVSIRHQ